MKDEWYSPGQIRYLRDDIIWFIAVVLPLGIEAYSKSPESYDEQEVDVTLWPPDGKETGYTGIKKATAHSAPFETICCTRGEIVQRLDMTGDDGGTLVWEIQVGGVEDYIFLSPAAKRALNYISSGKKRRRTKKGRLITYAEWKRDRKKIKNKYQK